MALRDFEKLEITLIPIYLELFIHYQSQNVLILWLMEYQVERNRDNSRCRKNRKKNIIAVGNFIMTWI